MLLVCVMITNEASSHTALKVCVYGCFKLLSRQQ